jgi:hypothetical protein
MPRSDPQLQKASYDAFYEFDMLRECMTALGPYGDSKKLDPKGRLVRNALLESFLIHLRNLLVFLHYVDKTHENDVRAAEFVKDWGKPKTMPACVSDAYRWVCVRIAHLSYERQDVGEDDRDWPVGAIYAAIGATMKEWLERTPSHLLDEVWKKSDPFAGRFEAERASAGVPTGMIKF